MTQQEIADRIRQLRRKKSFEEKRDVTQEEVAQKIGVSLESFSRYENGKRRVPEDAIQALARYYGAEPSFIRYGITASRVALTDEEVEAAMEKSAADRAARGLPPIGPEDVLSDTAPHAQAPRKAAGGPRPTKRPRGGK